MDEGLALFFHSQLRRLDDAPKSRNGRFAVLRAIGGGTVVGKGITPGAVALCDVAERKILWCFLLRKVGSTAVADDGTILTEEVISLAPRSALVAVKDGKELWRKNFRRFFEFAGFSSNGLAVAISLLPDRQENRFFIATGATVTSRDFCS